MSAPFVFLDFEASGLDPSSFPIEIGWVSEDGQGEAHLIRPAPGWTFWSPEAERIHGISMETLMREGKPHDLVARRVVAAFSGRRPVASAPKWDGGWLSKLLEAAGLPDRFEILDSDKVDMMAASPLLELLDPEDTSPRRYTLQHAVRDTMQEIIGDAHYEEEIRSKVAHRALADAERLWRIWRSVGERANASLTRARSGSVLSR